MNPLSLIERLINEHGSSTILGERLLLLKDELSKVERERDGLQKKCLNLEKEVSSLREELNKKSVSSDFAEVQGVLFKRDSTGSYTPTAYCPECKRPLWSTEPDIFPYQCSTKGCGFAINISEDLKSIAARLNSKGS